MLLSRAIDGFIIAKQADGLSPNTLSIYRWALSKFVAFCGDAPLDNVTTDDVRRWLVFLRDEYQPEGTRKIKRLAQGSLQNAFTAIKSFDAWCAVELNATSITANVKRITAVSPVIHVLSEGDIRALLKAAECTTTRETDKRKSYTQKRPTGARNVALLLLLLDTGLRVGEASRLRVGDIAMDNGAVTVTPFQSGRKSKPRIVYLGKAARRALWKFMAERDDMGDKDAPLFLTDDGRPMSRDGMVLLVRRIGQRAGVPCHPHLLRHCFATNFLRNGGDVFALQRALGHTTLDMVRRYVETAQGDIEHAFRLASPADKWKL